MNVISYHEQVYLLYYWLRNNIKFEPTKSNIKEQLLIEFNVDDENVINEIYELFHMQ